MAKISELVDDPRYDSIASSVSKNTIFGFAATFGYMVIFSEVRPGFLGGAAFFFVGIFAASLAVSMPLFLLGAKFPRLGVVFPIADVALTILLTRTAYALLFAGSEIAVAGLTFSCREPLPEFTLDYDSDPSESELEYLCACIWKNMDDTAKEIALKISEGKGSVPEASVRVFAPTFGRALEECGGNRL